MSTIVENTLRLHELRISNFLRVEALTVHADGRHVEISGPNASGKTSAVDAIWSALGGKPARELPEPIHSGFTRAEVTLDLGEYVVTRHWTQSGSRLVVTAADGSAVRRPQELLNGLIGRYSLDPIAFLDRRPQDQVDDVLQICAVEPPTTQVKDITGQDHDPRPGESADAYLMRLSADDVGLYYVRRRDAGRDVDLKRDALKDSRDTLQRLEDEARDITTGRSAEEIAGELDQLTRAADERRQAMQEAGDAAAKCKRAEDRLASIWEDLQRSQQASQRIEKRIGELERQIAEARQQLATEAESQAALELRILDGDRVVAELRDTASRAQSTAEAFEDVSPRITALRQELSAAGRSNALVAKRQHQNEQVERLAVEYERATIEHKRLDDVLEKLRYLRAHLLDDIDLGVPGLEVGHGELRLNGVSFRQASMAEQIRTACAVAMRQKPRLRLLRIDEGERLDSHSREMVLSLAEENGFQVIMTRVADSENLRVEIVDCSN